MFKILQNIQILQVEKPMEEVSDPDIIPVYSNQCFGSGSGSVRIPFILASQIWIRIRFNETDPDPDPGSKKSAKIMENFNKNH